MSSPSESRRRKRHTSQGFLTGYWGGRGGFCSIPAVVTDGPDWCSLSLAATKLLFVLARQYKGDNNGDLCATESVMSKHGIASSNTINRSLKELLEKGLIVKTQTGYRGADGTRKPNLYALAWLPVDDINQRVGSEWIPKIKGTSKPTWTPPCRANAFNNNLEVGQQHYIRLFVGISLP